MKVTKKKTALGENLDKFINEIKGKQLKVGFFENQKYPDKRGGLSVAMVAAIQEYSYPKASFMRSTADDKKEEWKKTLKAFSREIVLGNYTVKEALNASGSKFSGDIREKIESLKSIPLKKATIRQRIYRDAEYIDAKTKKGKKSVVNRLMNNETYTRRLVDTGILLGSVTHQVE